MAPDDQIIYRVERLTAEYIGCIDDDALERWPLFFTAGWAVPDYVPGELHPWLASERFSTAGGRA